MEAHKGAGAVVVILGCLAHLVDCYKAGLQELPDFGRLRRRNSQTKGYAELGKHVYILTDGIAAGNGCALGVVALLLAPYILCQVVVEVWTQRVRRGRQALYQVGHLGGVNVGRHLCIQSLHMHCSYCRSYSQNNHSFHLLYLLMLTVCKGSVFFPTDKEKFRKKRCSFPTPVRHYSAAVCRDA